MTIGLGSKVRVAARNPVFSDHKGENKVGHVTVENDMIVVSLGKPYSKVKVKKHGEAYIKTSSLIEVLEC